MLNTLRNDCGKTDQQTLLEYGYTNYPGDFGNMTILTGGEIPPLWGSNMDSGGGLVQTLLSIDWTRVFPNAPEEFCPNSPTLEGPVPPTGV
jgi:hypothetical protein